MQLVAPPLVVVRARAQCATKVDVAPVREAFVRRDALDHVVESVDQDADRLLVLILIEEAFLVESRAKPRAGERPAPSEAPPIRHGSVIAVDEYRDGVTSRGDAELR